MHLRTIAALLCSAALISGCGPAASTESAQKFKGAEREVATVIDKLADATSRRRSEDIDAICTRLLSPGSVAAIAKKQGEPCGNALKDLLGAATTRDIKVEKVVIKGDRATAAVKIPTAKGKDQRATMTLRKIGRTWRIVLIGND